MIRISAWLAIVFGLALAVLEAVRNWGDWQWWPFWVVDYVAATLLVVGGVQVVRRSAAHSWLTAGWGFACAMFWMSFFGHWGDAMAAAQVSAREQRLTLIIGVMFALTIVGLVSSLAGRRNEKRPA